MATKTVKDEKTADVPAGKNSARVKHHLYQDIPLMNYQRQKMNLMRIILLFVQRFQGQTRIYLLWKKLKKLYQNLKTRR